jgi:argininosuccinate synthase
MKCRGVYETPGGAILYKAHSVLETLCLDKITMHEKQKLAITYGELVYNGQWFTPLREALAAFVDKTQENVTGKVRLKLYKGNMINAGAWSEHSLYSEEIATFGESDYNDAFTFNGVIGSGTFNGQVSLVGGDMNSDVAVLKLDITGSKVTKDKIVKSS